MSGIGNFRAHVADKIPRFSSILRMNVVLAVAIAKTLQRQSVPHAPFYNNVVKPHLPIKSLMAFGAVYPKMIAL
jgi:hypothetical protein